MTDLRATLLLTRPKAAALRFADQVRDRIGSDIPVVISPLMETHWLSPQVPLTGYDALVFTSETGVKAFCRQTADRSALAWCVGDRTAKEARRAGFAVETGPGDAEGLASLMRERCAGAAVLWPCGMFRARDLASLLAPAEIRTTVAPLYSQDTLPLSEQALALLAESSPVLVPLFSARSARLFHDAAGQPCAPLWVAALSQAVADALQGLDCDRLAVAARPDADAMLSILQKWIKDDAGG